ncbi:DivIVA domain-containing protein [Streptomyces sp. JNUCC 64]
MFLFLLLALVVVVGAVTLAVVGGGESGPLPTAPPERFTEPLPPDRPVTRADVDGLRFPLALRGYRMAEVDEALGRLGAELSERDVRIQELTVALTVARAVPATADRAPAGPALTKTGPATEDAAPAGDPAGPAGEPEGTDGPSGAERP